MFQLNKNIIRWIVIVASFVIVALILWNTYNLSERYKKEERLKMELLAIAYERYDTFDLDADFSLESLIIHSNHKIPMIITNEKDSILDWGNLDSIKAQNTNYLESQLVKMKNQNQSIVIKAENFNRIIYYSNSNLLTKLKFYPIAFVLVLFLFASVIYLFFKSNKIADQNKLWTGMAKETAHQIGTPLSSLLGWIEILKMENVEDTTVKEIENDVKRLNAIANRFSKIGSTPILTSENIVSVAKNSYHYLESRSSKNVKFNFETQNSSIFIKINASLFSWVIENLVKNAIDAMEGKGEIKLQISEREKRVIIRISDSGKGIPKKLYKQIFSPGYTTKKRGWGLGLSLAKRIVEEYHKGKIWVFKSKIGFGTTFEIFLNK